MVAEGIEEFNIAIRQWGANTRSALLLKMMSLGLKERVELRKTTKKHIRRLGIGKEQGGAILRQIAGEETLYESLREKYRRNDGEIYFVSFPFNRKGIFLAHGVSKKHPKSNPRKKVNFYSDVMDVQSRVLSEIVANGYSGMVEKEILKIGRIYGL